MTLNAIKAAHTVQTIADELEPSVDAHGLSMILDALALVCSEKADHVRENWQDEATAKVWEDMAGQILRVHFKAASAFR